ncbi:acyl-CoA N-acyltransferase [Annulohypoxylon bovei var. microspora]|nr:acyl-CoA N-acyltransferase [Annulohypoxylon bovei var. microspora]
MSLQVRKATVEDVPAIVDTFFDAFHDHPLTIRSFTPRTESVQKYWIETIDADMRDPSTHFLVITDSAAADPERILAFGKWRDMLTSTSPEAPAPPSWPEGADVPFTEKFFGTVEKKHIEIMKDRPHWYLDMLGVRKELQRKGAGSRLVQWGVAKADEAGVEAYLAASPAGAPMYKKHGFEIHETVPMGEEGRLETFMVRPAKKP